MKIHTQYNSNTGMPSVGIRIEAPEGQKIEVTFCNFRRYDWCWSFAGVDAHEGYAFGMDICNRGADWLPFKDDSQIVVDLREIRLSEILRASLCAALIALREDLTRRVDAEFPADVRSDGHAAIVHAMEVLAPAWLLLLKDAKTCGASMLHFARLAEQQTEGCNSIPMKSYVEAFTCAGFTPSSRWNEKLADRPYQQELVVLGAKTIKLHIPKEMRSWCNAHQLCLSFERFGLKHHEDGDFFTVPAGTNVGELSKASRIDWETEDRQRAVANANRMDTLLRAVGA